MNVKFANRNRNPHAQAELLCPVRAERTRRGCSIKGFLIESSPNLLASRQLINSNSSQPLTLNDLAQTAGMSPPYFCSQFKKFFGLAPVEYLIQHRMLHAAHLLADRNLTLSEIAMRVGYNAPLFFSKMFKKHFGQSPREMRNRI